MCLLALPIILQMPIKKGYLFNKDLLVNTPGSCQLLIEIAKGPLAWKKEMGGISF